MKILYKFKIDNIVFKFNLIVLCFIWSLSHYDMDNLDSWYTVRTYLLCLNPGC